MYCSSDINEIMKAGKSDLLGFHFYPDFCGLLEKLFRKYQITVEYSFDVRVGVGDCWIGGLYDHEITRNNVIVCLLVSPNTDKVLIEDNWKYFSFVFVQTLQHELIHRHQYDVRPDDCALFRYEFLENDPTRFEEREYLSHADEIDAYAHCIALELNKKYRSETIKRYLRNPTLIRGCPSWKSYEKAFSGTEWGDVRLELLKHIYKWLPTAIPYKE